MASMRLKVNNLLLCSRRNVHIQCVANDYTTKANRKFDLSQRKKIASEIKKARMKGRKKEREQQREGRRGLSSKTEKIDGVLIQPFTLTMPITCTMYMYCI